MNFSFTLPAGCSLGFCVGEPPVARFNASLHRMECVSLHTTAEGQSWLVASNGKIVAIHPIKVNNQGEVEDLRRPLLLPAKACRDSIDEKVTVIVTDGEVRKREEGEDASIVWPLPSLDGTLPGFGSIIPSAEAVAGYRKMALNSRYLALLANAIDADGQIVLHIPKDHGPVVVTAVGKGEGVGIIMPIYLSASSANALATYTAARDAMPATMVCLGAEKTE